jgi:pyruvate kinase
MNQICLKVEADPHYRHAMAAQENSHDHSASDAITAAARQVASTIGAALIVTFTSSGSTALRASRERPSVPILCLTPKQETARKMRMAYGAYPVIMPDIETFSQTVEHALRIVKSEQLAEVGDKFVITAGVPFGRSGTTNILRIATVE